MNNTRKILIIIPAYNEEGSVGKVAEETKGLFVLDVVFYGLYKRVKIVNIFSNQKEKFII